MNKPPICDYTGSDYQASFWATGKRDYENRVEQVALKRLLPTSGNLLLEIGAGAGRNTPRYAGFAKVVLLDYSLTQIEQAKAKLGNSNRYVYVVGDAYQLPFVAGLFDSVTMIRTLHHIVDVPRVFKQINRVLRPGSTLILEYASKHHIKAILRYLVGLQAWNPFTTDTIEFTPLNFNFHPKQIKTWLEDQDFIISDQLSVSHFRLAILKRLIPLRLLVSLDSVLQKTGRWWQLTPSVFIKCLSKGENIAQKNVRFFMCPHCGGDQLVENPREMVCLSCGKNWPIEDGIYIFRDL